MVVSPIPNDAEDSIRRGARFRAARLARGIGQAELGRRVGATQSLIGQIECGRILRSKYETLIMFELGIPLDPETERWILASRQSGAGAGAGGAASAAPPPDGAQGAQDPALQDAQNAAEQDSAQPANAPARYGRHRPTRARPRCGGGSPPTTSSSPPSACASAARAAPSSRSCSTARSATSMPSSRRSARPPARCARSSSRAASRAAPPMWAAATTIAPPTGAGSRCSSSRTRSGHQEPVRDGRALSRQLAGAAGDRRGQCQRASISTCSIPATRSAPPAPAASGAPPPCSCCTAPRWRSGRMRRPTSPACCRRCPTRPAPR